MTLYDLLIISIFAYALMLLLSSEGSDRSSVILNLTSFGGFSVTFLVQSSVAILFILYSFKNNI
jgi:hypothetical protein